LAIDITIEKVWRYKKSTCVAVINHATGTRNGYCSVSMAHPFYRKNYTHESISELDHNIDDVIHVHGGITYSGDIEWALELDSSLPHNQWWFGFDCYHASDAPDPELINDPAAKKFMEHMEESLAGSFHFKKTHKDLNYVVEQCQGMAEYLSKFVYNSVDFILNEEDSKTSHLHAV